MVKTNKAFNVALATTLAASAVVAVAPTQAEAAKSFSDVKASNSHYANILNLTERGIINGYEDGTFRPGESIKRGHAAKIIAAVLELDTVNVKDPGFKDLSKNNPYYGEIAALANEGIINGFEDNTYRANATLTRGQMAKIIANAFGLKSNGEVLPFTDITNSQYKENVAALFANNVTTGVTATKFDTASNVTRGQLASFVVRAETATQDKVVSIDGTISSIEDGKVMIGNAAYDVAPELAGVFSKENVAALQEADVELVVEYTFDNVASVAPIAAFKTAKIIGIKKVKLTQPNTTFNANGFNIPQIIVAAKNVTLQQLVTALVSLLKEATAMIENSQIAKVETTDKEAVKVDEASKVEEVIVEETTTPGETEEVPVPAPTPGSSGSSATALDKVVKAAVTKANNQYKDALTFSFNESSNVIAITVIDGEKTIADVRKDMKNYADDTKLTLTSLAKDLSFAEVGALLTDVESVTVTVGDINSKTAKVEDYIDGLDVDRKKVVGDADAFVDQTILKTDSSVLTLADVKETFANNIKIVAGKETYTVTVK